MGDLRGVGTLAAQDHGAHQGGDQEVGEGTGVEVVPRRRPARSPAPGSAAAGRAAGRGCARPGTRRSGRPTRSRRAPTAGTATHAPSRAAPGPAAGRPGAPRRTSRPTGPRPRRPGPRSRRPSGDGGRAIAGRWSACPCWSGRRSRTWRPRGCRPPPPPRVRRPGSVGRRPRHAVARACASVGSRPFALPRVVLRISAPVRAVYAARRQMPVAVRRAICARYSDRRTSYFRAVHSRGHGSCPGGSRGVQRRRARARSHQGSAAGPRQRQEPRPPRPPRGRRPAPRGGPAAAPGRRLPDLGDGHGS